MSREIKFRAWDTSCCFMYLPNTIEKINIFLNGSISINDVCYVRGTSEILLMQYTGLHDKNGKEIYEGDIMKSKYGTVSIVSSTLETSCGSCCTGVIHGWEFEDTYTSEIIGNIYENPELLEAK